MDRDYGRIGSDHADDDLSHLKFEVINNETTPRGGLVCFDRPFTSYQASDLSLASNRW